MPRHNAKKTKARDLAQALRKSDGKGDAKGPVAAKGYQPPKDADTRRVEGFGRG